MTKRKARARAVKKKTAKALKIPAHLSVFISKQDTALYTPMDHASWRFIMRVSKKFFATRAHSKYLVGLKETGISTERIPRISDMDRKLRRFGWRAVPVVGFIPPAVFMEFLSLGILPIACDMRVLEHLSYTPAPDIVHEAAGHAPIIADKRYAEYLRRYGEVSRNAIISKQDLELYDAIREMSDTKENPASTSADIHDCEKKFEAAVSRLTEVSEGAQLARMAWWTTEYGLVGSLEEPKIYGAGLLSSIGESYHCFDSNVRKKTISMDCVRQGYDITKPQPQLYVTPDFATLERVLDEFADTMAFRRGGKEGLEKACRAQSVCMVELETGIQLSGVLSEIVPDRDGNPAYLRFSGPCQLASNRKECPGHGARYHKEGFGTPIGRIQTRRKLATGKTQIVFESGVCVEGVLRNTLKRKGREVILTFENCRVTLGDRVLFDPDWGVFDMAVGERVVSVAGNAADRAAYLSATGGYQQTPAQPKSNLTRENADLCKLYAQVRALRERRAKLQTRKLSSIAQQLEKTYPEDWLLRLEMIELGRGMSVASAQRHRVSSWLSQMESRLAKISQSSPEKAEMIRRGLDLFEVISSKKRSRRIA